MRAEVPPSNSGEADLNANSRSSATDAGRNLPGWKLEVSIWSYINRGFAKATASHHLSSVGKRARPALIHGPEAFVDYVRASLHQTDGGPGNILLSDTHGPLYLLVN